MFCSSLIARPCLVEILATRLISRLPGTSWSLPVLYLQYEQYIPVTFETMYRLLGSLLVKLQPEALHWANRKTLLFDYEVPHFFSSKACIQTLFLRQGHLRNPICFNKFEAPTSTPLRTPSGVSVLPRASPKILNRKKSPILCCASSQWTSAVTARFRRS